MLKSNLQSIKTCKFAFRDILTSFYQRNEMEIYINFGWKLSDSVSGLQWQFVYYYAPAPTRWGH